VSGRGRSKGRRGRESAAGREMNKKKRLFRGEEAELAGLEWVDVKEKVGQEWVVNIEHRFCNV
jgi:hypothetical protein